MPGDTASTCSAADFSAIQERQIADDVARRIVDGRRARIVRRLVDDAAAGRRSRNAWFEMIVPSMTSAFTRTSKTTRRDVRRASGGIVDRHDPGRRFDGVESGMPFASGAVPPGAVRDRRRRSAACCPRRTSVFAGIASRSARR